MTRQNVNGRTALSLAVEEQRDPLAARLILRGYRAAIEAPAGGGGIWPIGEDAGEEMPEMVAVFGEDLRVAARWAALERPRSGFPSFFCDFQ